MAAAEVENISELVPHQLGIPYKKVWVDYSHEPIRLY